MVPLAVAVYITALVQTPAALFVVMSEGQVVNVGAVLSAVTETVAVAEHPFEVLVTVTV